MWTMDEREALRIAINEVKVSMDEYRKLVDEMRTKSCQINQQFRQNPTPLVLTSSTESEEEISPMILTPKSESEPLTNCLDVTVESVESASTEIELASIDVKDKSDLAIATGVFEDDDLDVSTIDSTQTEVTSDLFSADFASVFVSSNAIIGEESFATKFCVSNTVSDLCLLRVCGNASVNFPSFRAAHRAFNPNWYSFQPFHIASMHPNPPWKPPDNRTTSYLTTDKSYTYWKLPTNVFLVDFSLDLGLKNTENMEDNDGYKFVVPACVQSRHTNFCSSGVCQNVNETFHSCSIMQCGLNACQCILFDWKYVQLILAWYMRLTDFSIVMRIGENDQVVHIWELLTWTFQRTTWRGKESCMSQIYSHLPHMRIVWNGLAMNGNSEAALTLFSQMKRYKDGSPNEVIFIGVLTACSHGGFVDKGYFYLKEMTQCYDLHPCIEHYGCVVDLLGRANLWDEALKFIYNLPVQPDAVMRCSLLFACRSHGNIELAEYAAAQVRKLNPTTCGSPVLLANVYASALCWGDVKKIMENMAQLGMHEQPSCSSIEINGLLHAFLVKVHSDVKYVVDTDKGIIITMSTPTSRVTFQNDNHTLHFVLHRKVNLLGNLMKGKRNHDSFANDGLFEKYTTLFMPLDESDKFFHNQADVLCTSPTGQQPTQGAVYDLYSQLNPSRQLQTQVCSISTCDFSVGKVKDSGDESNNQQTEFLTIELCVSVKSDLVGGNTAKKIIGVEDIIEDLDALNTDISTDLILVSTRTLSVSEFVDMNTNTSGETINKYSENTDMRLNLGVTKIYYGSDKVTATVEEGRIFVANIVSYSIQPLQNVAVLKNIGEKVGPHEQLPWVRSHITRGFLALEKLLRGHAGKYTTGDDLYMADLFLAPLIQGAINRFNVDMAEFPTPSRLNESYEYKELQAYHEVNVEAKEVHIMSSAGYINYISMFSLPRPPEVNDLEDKVQFKGDRMIQAKTWAESRAYDSWHGRHGNNENIANVPRKDLEGQLAIGLMNDDVSILHVLHECVYSATIYMVCSGME